jgi:hypothetical protein
MPRKAEGVESKNAQLHILTVDLNFGTRHCLYALLDDGNSGLKKNLIS